MIYRFIKENRSAFPVKKMCHVLNVSPSGYYRWCKAPLSTRKLRNKEIKERIRQLFIRHNGMAGSPMIAADLRDDPAYSDVSRNRVAKLMKDMGLKSRTIKKFVVTTNSKHSEPVAPNQALFQYIEVYYNRQRKHSTNGYKSPFQYEQEWWENKNVA